MNPVMAGLIVLGYAIVVWQGGWVGAIAVLLHIAVMVFSARGR